MSGAGRTPMVAGNWKMNTTIAEGVALAREVIAHALPSDVEVLMLPPFTHLHTLGEILDGSGVQLGAQDCFWEASGAYTGEVSPRMLVGLCGTVLVGHSERRWILHETDADVGRKACAALAEGLRVIVAVGETLEEREAGDAGSVVRRQLDAALAGVSPVDLARCAVAYEPIWAIGTGRTATAADAQAMCLGIRRHLASLAGEEVAATMRILYGGSMNAGNAADLLAEADIDGGLIGGASLRADQFCAIVAAAAATRER